MSMFCYQCQEAVKGVALYYIWSLRKTGGCCALSGPFNIYIEGYGNYQIGECIQSW